jgi:hypothetical protein
LAEHEPVFLEATSRFLRALSMRRMSEAIKWLTDLMYYASLEGLDDQYLKLYDRMLREVDKMPPPFPERFTESLDRVLDKIMMGSEYALIGGTLDKALKLKMDRMGKYVTTPEEFKRKAKKILDEILKG